MSTPEGTRNRPSTYLVTCEPMIWISFVQLSLALKGCHVIKMWTNQIKSAEVKQNLINFIIFGFQRNLSHKLRMLFFTKKIIDAFLRRPQIFLIYLSLSLVFLLISNLASWLRLHQFLRTCLPQYSLSLQTDANRVN